MTPPSVSHCCVSSRELCGVGTWSFKVPQPLKALPETARFPPALVALIPVCYDKTQVVRQQSESQFPNLQRSCLKCHSKGMSLFITQLHFRPFPTPDFIKRPVVFAAHFLVLVIKAVGKPRFSSPI